MHSTPFQEAAVRGAVRFQRCAACKHAISLTCMACPRCGAAELTWQEAVGSGAVYATTEVNRPPSEAFQALVPYLLVLVDLDEGVRVMAHGAPGLEIGDRVCVRNHPHPAAAGLLYFEPTST